MVRRGASTPSNRREDSRTTHHDAPVVCLVEPVADVASRIPQYRLDKVYRLPRHKAREVNNVAMNHHPAVLHEREASMAPVRYSRRRTAVSFSAAKINSVGDATVRTAALCAGPKPLIPDSDSSLFSLLGRKQASAAAISAATPPMHCKGHTRLGART